MDMEILKSDAGVDLEPVSDIHQKALFELIEANRQYLSEWLEWTDQLQTDSEMVGFIESCKNKFRNGSDYIYCIFKDRLIVGVIGLKDVSAEGEAEIGCWLAEDMQGQGIMFSALKALMDHAFAHLGIYRVIALVAEGNSKSEAACLRGGFTLEGYKKEALHGTPVNHSVFVSQHENKLINALKWIDAVFARNKMGYQIVGGLAARIYGSRRPVADIDIFISSTDSESFLKCVGEFISKPMTRRKEEGWDVEYVQLNYEGQKIEVGLDRDCKVLSSETNMWVDLLINLSSSVRRDFLSISLPVMPVDQLISYKSHLARDVDLRDIKALEHAQQ